MAARLVARPCGGAAAHATQAGRPPSSLTLALRVPENVTLLLELDTAHNQPERGRLRMLPAAHQPRPPFQARLDWHLRRN